MTRDFATSTFVVWRGKVLLHKHKKLGMWLPPGGHIDPDEIPDDGAVREVLEESGVLVELLGERTLEIDKPRQLIRPRGVQVESIGPGHEHIDLIYFARPIAAYDGYLLEDDISLGWYGPEDFDRLAINDEIRQWVKLALKEVPEVAATAPARVSITPP